MILDIVFIILFVLLIYVLGALCGTVMQLEKKVESHDAMIYAILKRIKLTDEVQDD